MRIGIMGGTFDPIHIGHLLIAEQARIECDLDQVWFIPTHIPPHKKHSPRASNEHRWNMVCQAIANHPHFHPHDIELLKPGVSYSIETIEQLRKQYPDDEFMYVIGADMLADLPKWYRFSELIQQVRFLVVNRSGYPLTLEVRSREMQDRIRFLNMPVVDISSTQIRTSIAQHVWNRYWLSDVVYAYIKEHQLYES